ncbi:hypothetical protein V3Q77_08220 [Flavobacterium davisii]|uniref:Uncharacterized protein n=1 Tax=Flavobacterium davisii TaxID=2906077 RepID=A0ABW8PPN3_9FLAO
MAGEIDILLAEQQTGKAFASRVKRNLLASIRSKTKQKTGKAFKTSVKPVFKNGFLDRITITTPYYIYPILTVGFEGTKKNGVNARLKALDFFNEALENGKLVNDLADAIGAQRAEQVVARINFSSL